MPRPIAPDPVAGFELPAVALSQLQTHRISGHLLQVERKSGKRWHAQWRDGAGRQRQKVLGKVWTGRGRPADGHLTKQGAQDLLDTLLATEREKGPQTGRRGEGVTFATAAAEWLRYVEHDRKRAPSTLRDYTLMVDKRLGPIFGRLPTTAFSPELVDDFRAHLVAEGRLQDRSINKYLLVLHAIFKRAQRHYGLPSNPVAGVDRQPVKRSTEFRVLSNEEVAALCRAAREGRHRVAYRFEPGEEWQQVQRELDAQDAAIFTTAAYAGLRMGEIRGLRWRDVDFANRLIHVRRSYSSGVEGVPKSQKPRAVPLIDQVLVELDALSQRDHHIGKDDLVFVSPTGGFIEDSALRRRLYRACDAADIERLRFHDLRHSFGTLAVQVFPLSDVKAYLGHADIATTMLYVHHVPQHDAAAKLSAAVGAAGVQSTPRAAAAA